VVYHADYALSHPGERHRRVVLTFTDITRLKHLGDQLQEALNYAQGIVETRAGAPHGAQ